MKNLANLNSAEWCDIIFENKNKEYGAFELRQSSWKRHILAFGIIVIGITAVSFLPMIIESVSAKQATPTTIIDEERTIAQIEHKQEDLIAEALPPAMPEPPKFIKMDKFVAMTIVEDDQADNMDELKGMEELTKSNKAIGAFNVEDGSTDEDAVRKTLENAMITSEGGKGGGQQETKPVYHAEFMPQFPGGESEMYKFISENLRYPAIDQEIGNEGRVSIRFVVTKTGEISDVQILRGVSSTCDKEAVRVIKNMPKWIPGKQNGNPVPVYFTLPIIFKLKK